MSADLGPLIAELFATIHVMAGYPLPTVAPAVHRVPHAQIEAQFCRSRCAIRALYDPTLGVHIDERLDVQNDTFDRSILLHELVHHVQAVSGRFDMGSANCSRRNAAEREAYALQNRYLMEMNDARRVSMNGWALRCTEAEVPVAKKP